MANIKWSGIEQKKYGLTASWYVSAYYGNDNDVDVVGLYDRSTNPAGHGGPTRPFATVDKLMQISTSGNVAVFDSGYYTAASTKYISIFVGDGTVVFADYFSTGTRYYNTTLINLSFQLNSALTLTDCMVAYCTNMSAYVTGGYIRTVFIESAFGGSNYFDFESCLIIRTSSQTIKAAFKNTMIIDSPDLRLEALTERPAGYINDYSIIIGIVKTTNAVNGKTTGVTIEDFKADGNYFVKSFSEVDLWGNASGSGASVSQLQELFCNYFSPIYLDTWNEANFHLKTSAPDILKYGGLNGTYIGALPVMHWFTAADLWDNYQDPNNTSDLEKDAVSGAIRISGAAESGTFRSTKINLPKVITANPAKFFANLVYNIEGTVKQGVSNQRIDTTVDLQPDNTENQRVVYDFKMAVAPNTTDALGAFKNYELDREPTVDSQGRSHLDDNFDSTTEAKQTIGAFMIEFTLRKVIIE